LGASLRKSKFGVPSFVWGGVLWGKHRISVAVKFFPSCFLQLTWGPLRALQKLKKHVSFLRKKSHGGGQWVHGPNCNILGMGVAYGKGQNKNMSSNIGKKGDRRALDAGQHEKSGN